MSITLRQVSDVVVKRVPIEIDERPVRGADICAECFCNIFFCAQTNSGKTTCLYTMVKKMITKGTKVYLFVSTLYNDRIWGEIRKYLTKKKFELHIYTSIIEDGVNHLRDLVDQLVQEAKERDEEEEEMKKRENPEDPTDPREEIPAAEIYMMQHRINGYGKEEDKLEEKKPPRRSKYQPLDYLIIFDDLADEIKSMEYQVLLKKARHFHIKTITSSQYLKDMVPDTRKQIRLWILFRGLSSKLLETVYESIGGSQTVPFDLFVQLYHHATRRTKKSPYPFFYACPLENDFRREFRLRYEIPSEHIN